MSPQTPCCSRKKLMNLPDWIAAPPVREGPVRELKFALGRLAA